LITKGREGMSKATGRTLSGGTKEISERAKNEIF
jgi:hypothetical protein